MSSVTVDLSQLSGLRGQVRDWGDQVKDQVAMAGAAAGARVLYDEARTFAPMSEKAHYFYGRSSRKTGVKYLFQPGNLREAIYRKFSPEKSGPTLKTYRISWNHIKAPYGHMVEFGTSRAPAHPFLGAALAFLPSAFAAAKVEMGAQLVTIGRGAA